MSYCDLLVKQFKGKMKKFGKNKMKNVITYADSLTVGLTFCIDGMSMPTAFLTMPTPT
jgi:hypothetical protein